MAQCRGITKSGARCKRPAGEGASYCASHVGQEDRTAGSKPAPEERAPRRDPDSFGRLALIGVVTIALLALRRVIRG